MKKKKLFLLATVFLMGISAVSAASYEYKYKEIKNLSSGSEKSTTESKLTTENYYTLSAERTGGGAATFTAYLIEPNAIIGFKDKTLAYGNMNFSDIVYSYSMKWDSKIGGGNKKLIFIGNTGTISFIPTLIGGSSK